MLKTHTGMLHKILLVEDEQEIADLLQIHLEKENASITHARTGHAGMEFITTVRGVGYIFRGDQQPA